MIESVKDYAIFMLSPEGIVVSWNEGAKRLKGYEASEIIGKSFETFYSKFDLQNEKPKKELLEAIEKGSVTDEGWRLRKDGTRFWAYVVITRVNDLEGNILGFAKVTRDLTERRLAEASMQDANRDLEMRIQRRTVELEHALQSRDEFLSIASHELKTPLTSLKLQLQMTELNLNSKQSFDREQCVQAVSLSLRQVESLSRLVEDLLDISRIRSGKFNLDVQPVNLSHLIKSITEKFKGHMDKVGSKLVLDLQEGVNGKWDPQRLEQIFTNLISNALKYAPGSPIQIKTTADCKNAVISILDAGPGIPQDKLNSIFERFERASEAHSVSGLGLGLYIVKKIVEAFEGKIHVKSEIGKFTEFKVEIPLEGIVD